MGERMAFEILHHGAVDGVTGSCHQLRLAGGASVLVDCGLFQGAETSSDGAGGARLEIGFPLDGVRALVVTHVHIDHVGRIPYLLAAGFEGPILCRIRCAGGAGEFAGDFLGRSGGAADAAVACAEIALRGGCAGAGKHLWRPCA